MFKDLVEKHAVFDAVVAEKMIADEDAKIDEKGVLKLKGRFQTAPKQVKYQLGFIRVRRGVETQRRPDRYRMKISRGKPELHSPLPA